MNDPGQSNGTLQTWINGSKAVDRGDMIWRGSGKNFEIDGLYFSTFFGGNDSSFQAERDEHVDFDDFVVSDRAISH